MRGGVLVFLAAVGCGGGSGVDAAPPCPPGELSCDGTCIDPLIDQNHCGNCETTCSADQECREGSCEIRCDVMLQNPVADDWGTYWDGVERPAVTFDEATAACTAIGGRLPTATELYRVRAGQPETIATPADTNNLWSATPSDRTEQITARLSDGALNPTPMTGTFAYRCACPARLPSNFSGARCHGPAFSPCFAMGDINVDNRDRPALRKNAAIWECAQERAHLADLPLLVEAVRAGLLGSGANVHTADQSRYDLSTTMHWTVGAWNAPGNTSWVDARTAAPFRCAGWGVATGTHPNAIDGEFVGPLGGAKGEQNDTAAADWAVAHDACTSRGGHLPRASELAELIMAGLPNGSDTMLWSADQVGYNDVNFLASVLRWPATDQRYPFDHGTTMTTTWAYKSSAPLPFRCIYYPIDLDYAPPSTCVGGCFELSLPGATPARMWSDNTDRAGKAIADAINECRLEGGHLASERDYTEAIRAGLPNGTDAWLITSDLALSYYHVVKWVGTAGTAYTDLWNNFMTWSNMPEVRPFRCMWTNELR